MYVYRPLGAKVLKINDTVPSADIVKNIANV